MRHPFTSFDDLKVVSSRQPDPAAMTLCAIGRNEMYFLPAFLEHYRKLGIEQFAILNDRSIDGTTEYLLSQPDVIVFESRYRYGDAINPPVEMAEKIRNWRILYIWRTILYARFAKSSWAVQTDLDEFIHLPPGKTFQDIARMLDRGRANVAYGLMLDVYPEYLSDLAAMAEQRQIDLGATWYFDAEPHLHLQSGMPPKIVHPGARARLYKTYGTARLYYQLGNQAPAKRSWWARMKHTRLGTRTPTYNAMHKPVMAKWPDGAYFTSSHNTTVDASDQILLPIQHFRFTGALYRKIEMAIQENSYSGGSRDHHLLSDLLKRMQAQRKATFLYQNSRVLNGFDDLRQAGVAIGL